MKKLKESLKRVLPRTTIDSLKKSQHRLSIQLVRTLASSALFRRVYFAFFSDAFDREARAVVVGHLRHVEIRGVPKPPTTSCVARSIDWRKG